MTELEGKSIEECKEEVDICQKYGADMDWARDFVLKFVDTGHAMTTHELFNWHSFVVYSSPERVDMCSY